MSFKTTTEELVAANNEFVKAFPGAPTFEQLGGIIKERGTPVGIISCVDPRAIPENIFGPNLTAPVFRNAGGRATDDVIRSFITLRTLISIKSIVVVHHTDCGMSHTTDEELKKDVKTRTPGADLDHMSFGCWTDERLEDTIKEDVLKLRNEPSLGGMEIRGFALETQTGAVKEVQV